MSISRIKIILAYNINAIMYNTCIKQNSAPIYATHEYLNAMAQNWAVVVLDDYKAVFPFCFKKKFGIKYVYMPAFVQQLGLIGKATAEEFGNMMAVFLKYISYGDIMVNHFTKNSLPSTIILKEQTNYTLHLQQSYNLLLNSFHTDVKRLTKRAQLNNLQYEVALKVNEAVGFYKNLYAERISKITAKDFDNFSILCSHLHKTNNCLMRKVVDVDKEILSISLFLQVENRMYNLANATSFKGRKLASNFLLYTSVIEEFANTNLIFDFEGSDLPGVKDFYKMFKPTNEPFYHWHINNLPFFMKWLKK